MPHKTKVSSTSELLLARCAESWPALRFGPGAMMPLSMPAELSPRPQQLLARAQALLTERGRSVDAVPGAGADATRAAATATALMDEYRRTGSAEVFEGLVGLTGPQLYARVRSGVRL